MGGLFAWRWVTTLAAFALLFATARRAGARGLTPLLVLVIAALVYRQRSQIRPETLVSVLMALELWILETRRSGGPDRSPWIVGIAWVWANAHISYHLGFALLGFFILDAHLAARTQSRNAPSGPSAETAANTPRGPLRLWLVALAALAISFVNPFGWRALWQPFDYFLNQRHESIFQTIGELKPLVWSVNWRNGLPLIVVLWPVLMLWRTWRKGFDLAEALLCAFFIALALSTVRFVGFLAIAAAPYLARDLDLWVRTRRWPRWTEPAWARAALVMLACVAAGLPEWTRADQPLGLSIDMRRYPVRALDFMAEHGVRGNGYNTFSAGGYMLHRFYPDRERLPFMDIHQSGTPEARAMYVLASQELPQWRDLERRFPFDYALLERLTFEGDRLPDFLDADSTWALVFIDDAAALYVKRGGPLAAIAQRFAYHVVPAGNAALARAGEASMRDPVRRAAFRTELERQVRESPYNAMAHGLLASLALIEANRDEAREHLRQALAVTPEDEELRARLAQLR